jgi:hypothetical protein
VIVAELAANDVTHGRVPGRDFELRLSLVAGSVRIEVTDTRAELRPSAPTDVPPPEDLTESCRGLVLVDALADRWEVLGRESPCKTVRAEIDVPGWLSLHKRVPNGATQDAGRGPAQPCSARRAPTSLGYSRTVNAAMSQPTA